MATTDYSSLLAELQDIWYEKIPLSKNMELSISSFDGFQLVTQARLEPNVNVHGTAFAGSLYAIQALTGWGMVHLQTRILEVNASIVIAHGNIDYAAPVKQDIVAVCEFSNFEEEVRDLLKKRKARFNLSCSVTSDNSLACVFNGVYAVKNLDQ